MTSTIKLRLCANRFPKKVIPTPNSCFWLSQCCHVETLKQTEQCGKCCTDALFSFFFFLRKSINIKLWDRK